MSSREPKTRDRILEATWRLMVERVGRNVRMGDVARGAGVSRQAVYDHFGSRAELMVATVRYGDGVLALNQRLRRYRAASSGEERLEAYVEFWGNYIPEIYGIARALLAEREGDEAGAAAWDDRGRGGCAAGRASSSGAPTSRGFTAEPGPCWRSERATRR